jgi:thioredoxin reductase (NADPH)
MSMDVIVIGDGPGGLSAALFLAKNGMKVAVYGQDKTAMHFALLKNYLGVPETPGTDFQVVAREQVSRMGAQIVDRRVESIAKTEDGFDATLEGGEKTSARYLILSEGKSPRLAQQLGLAYDEKFGLGVNINNQTSIEKVYAVGRLARPGRSQAIISAGDGAAAAIDILSIEKGEDFCDWDEPPKSE